MINLAGLSSMDEAIKAISSDGFVLISAVSTRELTERARAIHKSTPVVTAALGRTLSATSILGSEMKKKGASLTVRINGGGPAGSIIAVSDDEGNVRGYVQNPRAQAPRIEEGKLNVGAVVGNTGRLSVIKDFAEGEPYTGHSMLRSGEIAEDIAAYLAESEQIPTACGLGVLVGNDRSVLVAGGYVVQLLPGAPDEVISAVERNVEQTGAVTDVLASGGIEALLQSVMKGFSPKIIDRRTIEYRCSCSRDGVASAISGLVRSEIEDMRKKGEAIEVTCKYCDAAYTFSNKELETLNPG